MPPPSTNDIEITNYDVLADQVSYPINSDEKHIGLSLAAHSYHVGNNRLEVLCNIHSQAFIDNEGTGGEHNSDSIIEKIINIVQNQCVPKGRFLERNSKGEWSVVEDAKARSLVRQALMNLKNQGSSSHSPKPEQSNQSGKAMQEDDAEKKRRRRSSLLRRSVSSSMLPNLKLGERQAELLAFDDKKKDRRKGSVVRPTLSDLAESSSLKDSPSNSQASSPSHSRATSPVASDPRPQGTSQVRERDQAGVVPKQQKPLPALGKSRSVELGAVRTPRRLTEKLTGPPVVTETLKMDVLLNTSKTGLLPGTDLHGNNRLRVMLAIQTPAYKNAKEEKERTKMATELLNTIESFWGGRVLSLIPSMRKKEREVEQYIKLESIHAIQAIKNLLSGKATENEEEFTQSHNPDPVIKQGRRASLKAIESIAAASKKGEPKIGEAKTILPSTLPKLPEELQHLRSAAVKSLQKRKQRQGLNSRIRGLTADKAAALQEGNAGASVMTSSVTSQPVANVAPIPAQIISASYAPPSLHYRQNSSASSVGSSVSGNSYGGHQPVVARRQGSVCSSTSTVATSATAIQNMNRLSLQGHQSPLISRTVVNPTGMMNGGGLMLGSDLFIPSDDALNNVMTPMPNQQGQVQRRISNDLRQAQVQLQQMPQQSQLAPLQSLDQQITQQYSQQFQREMAQQLQLQMTQQQQMQLQLQQQQQRQVQQQLQFRFHQATMASVPEEIHNNPSDFSAEDDLSPAPLSDEELAMLSQQKQQQQLLQQQRQQVEENNNVFSREDRTSLLNSTGSDGLPSFAPDELKILMKGLDE